MHFPYFRLIFLDLTTFDPVGLCCNCCLSMYSVLAKENFECGQWVDLSIRSLQQLVETILASTFQSIQFLFDLSLFH